MVSRHGIFLFLFSRKLFLLHCCILCVFFRETLLSVFQTENAFAIPFRNHSENMGGKAIRSEPQQLMISAAAREILERAGWLNYFNRLQEANETVAMEFL